MTMQFHREYRYYELLGVCRDATLVEIGCAFARLAELCNADAAAGDADAQSKLQMLSRAYGVLADSGSRSEYDLAPAECPSCGSHELQETGSAAWRCPLCGCIFHVHGLVYGEYVVFDSDRRELAAYFEAFQATECSWCVNFFSRPRMCPYGGLRNRCVTFKRLSSVERVRLLLDDYWRLRATESAQSEPLKTKLRRCTECGALCPVTPKDASACWRCGHTLDSKCPRCGVDLLYFDVSVGVWRCLNNQCHGYRWTRVLDTGRWRSA